MSKLLKEVEDELSHARMALIRIMAKAEVALPDLGYHETALRDILAEAKRSIPIVEEINVGPVEVVQTGVQGESAVIVQGELAHE